MKRSYITLTLALLTLSLVACGERQSSTQNATNAQEKNGPSISEDLLYRADFFPFYDGILVAQGERDQELWDVMDALDTRAAKGDVRSWQRLMELARLVDGHHAAGLSGSLRQVFTNNEGFFLSNAYTLDPGLRDKVYTRVLSRSLTMVDLSIVTDIAALKRYGECATPFIEKYQEIKAREEGANFFE